MVCFVASLATLPLRLFPSMLKCSGAYRSSSVSHPSLVNVAYSMIRRGGLCPGPGMLPLILVRAVSASAYIMTFT